MSMRTIACLSFLAAACTYREPVLEVLGDAGTNDAGGGDAGGPRVPPYALRGEMNLDVEELVGMAKLPGPTPGVEWTVVLANNEANTNATVLVIDTESATVALRLDLPNEDGRQILAFEYSPGDPSRPVLVVATSNPANRLYLRLYDWDPTARTLLPHDRTTNATPGPLEEVCRNWLCGSQVFCPVGDECGQGEVCTEQWACPEGAPCADRRCVFENPSLASCGDPLAEQSPPGCGCQLKVEFGTEVSLEVADVDHDGYTDLIATTSSDLPVVTYRSSALGLASRAPGQPLYLPQGCECGRFAQAPTSFAVLNFGGLLNGVGEPASTRALDLALGAPGGMFLKYAQLRGDGEAALVCGQPQRVGDLVPVRHVTKGQLSCPRPGDDSCAGYEDLVVVAAKSLGGGSFDDPGIVRVVPGAPQDLTQEEYTAGAIELEPQRLPARAAPLDPRKAEIGDLDGDQAEDLAVLYGVGEVHLWFGASAGGILADRAGLVVADEGCTLHRNWKLVDVDGDQRDDVVVMCWGTPTASPRLRWFGAY
ncbi:MAG: hypothetical protein IPG45_22320 [Deltaproteobacteria bacterium]|nr:hypothetical protein [Deltaproteobacteria bacterium]